MMNTSDMLQYLRETDYASLDALFSQARELLTQTVGDKVYFRALIEISNYCERDCLYCGIRRNSRIPGGRYAMTSDEILRTAEWAYRNHLGSVTLQAGERSDSAYLDFITETIRGIKSIGNGALGITLSLGEQLPETYREWFEAGAHRYLLRIETSNPSLYAHLHPNNDDGFTKRLACLRSLREIGYQTGTGVMIGLPGQTEEDLLEDILFFKREDVAMIGMGPYVPHSGTPLGAYAIQNSLDSESERLRRLYLALKMIALTRIYLRDVNIASATALDALHPDGRVMGLRAGANVLMPLTTPIAYRESYKLYEKRLVDGNNPTVPRNGVSESDPSHELIELAERAGMIPGLGERGDSIHKSLKQAEKDL